MDLQTIAKMAPSGTWLKDLPRLKHFASHSFSKAKVVALAEQFGSHVEQGSAKKAINFLATGIVLSPGLFVGILRSKGLLRLSHYKFKYTCIPYAIAELLASDLHDELNDDVRDYLQSVYYLHEIGKYAGIVQDRIMTRLRADGESAIKAALAIVDAIFMMHSWDGMVPQRGAITSDTPEFFMREEYAEACSFLVFLYHEHIGKLRRSPALRASGLRDGSYQQLLCDAAHIREFFQLEIRIDHLGFTIRRESERIYSLNGPSVDYERAIAVGFILSEMQAMAFQADFHGENGMSLRKAGGMLYDQLADSYITLAATGLKRYVFRLPDIPQLWERFADNTLFEEEQLSLLWEARSLFAPLKDMADFVVSEDITVTDLIRAKRLMSIIRWYCVPKFMELLEIDPDNKEIVLESIVPFFATEELNSLLAKVVPRKKAETIINLLCWLGRANGVLDLQYQPLISVGNGYWVPMNLFSDSNIIRNTMHLVGKRMYADGKIEPLSQILEESLKKHAVNTGRNRKYSALGKEGEIDVIAVIGEIAYIFECKNSLLPTGPHELRTSLDYIKKAAMQLSIFKNEWNNPTFRTDLERTLGFPLKSVNKVKTCIVLSNRMFYGYRIDGHPVRGIYDLVQFLREGTFRSPHEVRRFWAQESFTGQDLDRYLDEDLTLKITWAGLVTHEETLVFGDTQVKRNAYVFDGERSIEAAQEFKLIEHTDPENGEH